LTDEQRHFAANNHGLIFSFLNKHGWDEREYYDIAAFGYLSAVRRYLARPELHQYAFSTIAWKSMERSIASFFRAEAQRTEAEQRYLEAELVRDPMDEMEARLLLHDLASVASRPQYELATLRLQGYSIAETARQRGMTPNSSITVITIMSWINRFCLNSYPTWKN